MKISKVISDKPRSYMLGGTAPAFLLVFKSHHISLTQETSRIFQNGQ